MKDNIWNIVLGALATAILTLLGYVLINLTAIQQEQSARRAVEFTIAEASDLQKELTKIVTDVDMRIRLIERDIQWIKRDSSIDGYYGGDGYMITELPVPTPDDDSTTSEENEEPRPDPTPPPPRYEIQSIKK